MLELSNISSIALAEPRRHHIVILRPGMSVLVKIKRAISVVPTQNCELSEKLADFPV
jgi:hypothetical protein